MSHAAPDLQSLPEQRTALALAQGSADWWVWHNCGAWHIGKGEEIGRVMLGTQNMGKSFSPKMPLKDAPQHVLDALIPANAAQLGFPNK